MRAYRRLQLLFPIATMPFLFLQVYSAEILQQLLPALCMCLCARACMQRGGELLCAKKTAELLKMSVRVSSNSSLLLQQGFKATFSLGLHMSSS